MNTPFSSTDFFALSPLIFLLAGGLFLIILESFFSRLCQKIAAPLTACVLIFGMAALYFAPHTAHPLLTPWLKFDPLARILNSFFLATGLAVTLLSSFFFDRFKASQGEYFFLLLSALFGLILVGSAADFLMLFIGLETLSISLYVLCGYIKRWQLSRESATKYFLMGALAAAFFLYGIALIYGATGTTELAALLSGYQNATTLSKQVLFFSGIGLVTLGLAFKAAIVPAHQWAPDVYEGAPTPVTAFMAVATKAGAFAAFIRIFLESLPNFNSTWNQAIALLVYPTLIYANFVAMSQMQLRRFFAYSGIAHAGFLLIPFASGGEEALPSLIFYLIVYGLATLSCFAILMFLDHDEQGATLNDLQGLFRRSPKLAFILSISLLTLAGIPPTAGFLAKFFILKGAFHSGYYGLVTVGLLTTILSAFYYLRMIALMLIKMPAEVTPPIYSYAAMTVAVLCTTAIFMLSVYPEPLLASKNLFKTYEQALTTSVFGRFHGHNLLSHERGNRTYTCQ